MSAGTVRPFLLDRPRLARWALLYAAFVVYGSLIVGPLGIHFVPRDPLAVWHEFLATRYVPHGSDQRPDWMANLVMLVPFGFLLAGALTPQRGRWRRAVGAGAAFVLCAVFVLVVKYAQLFFPGRTVTLNYIAAQGIGAFVGVTALALSRESLIARVLRPLAGGGRAGLLALLGVYAFLLLFFLLVPFDFVLSRSDLHERLAMLPDLVWRLPGVGRPTAVRAALILAGTLGMVPVGMLLSLAWPRRPLRWVALIGLATMLGVTALTLLILSAVPMFTAIVYRTAGIVAGAALLRRLSPATLDHARRGAARSVPWLWLPYLILLAIINGLLTPHWRTPVQAMAALDWRGLIPLWHDYIVPKAEAAKSAVVHVAMYAPIGAILWLRVGTGRRQAIAAGGLAALCSLAVELGRWMKPGLQPDFNEVAIGGLAAGLTVLWLPRAWSLLVDAVAASERGVPSVADREKATPSLAAAPAPILSDAARQRATVSARAGASSVEKTAEAVGSLVPRAILAVLCLVALAGLLARYPLPPIPLGAVLLAYAAGLWVRPGLWLLVVPAVLPAFDLTIWTGWLMVSESDAFLLVTLGVLVLRAPPGWQDMRLRALPGLVLAIVAVSLGVGVLRGLMSPYVLAHGSANPYLLPINALRLAKGVVWAFVLLPFLRARQRRHGDALERFGTGMVIGLAAVASAALVERALFPGVFDFSADYRVVATFSSMEFGGDDVGTYLALALPFLAVCLLRPRPARLAGALLIALGGVYALLVTYARAAYAAAVLGAAVTLVLQRPLARGRGLRGLARTAAVALFASVIGVTIGFGIDSGLMTARFRQVLPDFHTRLDNWTGGIALMDRTASAELLGMGLGTYPRLARLRDPPGQRPTNIILRHDNEMHYVRMRTGATLYFGQKVPVGPGRTYRLSLAYRVMTPGGGLSALLCEKLLLYSDTCHGVVFHPVSLGVWRRADVLLTTEGMDRRAVGGLLRRPVELSLSGTGVGETVDLADVRLLDRDGKNLVQNGDFRRGTDRWYFTDDSHLDWQIENQYLTTLFEGGALGLLAYLLVGGVAFAGAVRAARRGVPMAAPIAGALVAFLACGAFEDELAAPRMATLFYLTAFAGLSLWARDVEPCARARQAAKS